MQILRAAGALIRGILPKPKPKTMTLTELMNETGWTWTTIQPLLNKEIPVYTRVTKAGKRCFFYRKDVDLLRERVKRIQERAS